VHIVIFSEHFHKNPSGPRSDVLALSERFRADGHEVTILNMAQRKLDQVLESGTVVRQRPYRLRPLPVKYGKSMYFAWQLGFVHRARPIDCVLAMGLESGAAARRFRRRTGVPFVLSPRSGLTYRPGVWKFDRARMLTLECDAFIGLSRSATAAWLESTGVPEDGRFHSIHNGIDHNIHQGDVEPVPGVPDTRPLILCLGGLRTVKGQIQLLDALSRLQDLPWHTLFAGDGKQAQEIREHCSKLGLDGRTSWPGVITGGRWRWAFRHADLYCLTPIYPEAFGNTFLEAQLAGLPVVSSDCGALPEVVRNGETGFTVPLDDLLEGTVKALRTLLTDEPLRRRMGQAAREHAAGFSWEKTARLYAEVMQQCKKGES
jgi:glycosyltransferase involved in cell wall biosynthesis